MIPDYIYSDVATKGRYVQYFEREELHAQLPAVIVLCIIDAKYFRKELGLA
jgi:hypothetical protein